MAKIYGFLSGTDKYPEELLKNRFAVEGNVVSCMFKDILLVDEVKLSREDFLTKDSLFYYGMLRDLRKKGINSLDEISILSNSSEMVINGYEERGGWDTIQNQIDIINEKNFDTYIDALYRENNIIKLYNDGFNLFKEIDFNGKNIQIIKLLRKMSCEEINDFYESRLSMLDSGNNSKILEESDLEITDDFIDGMLEGEESGIPFDYAGEDINGDLVSCLPILSNQIDGFLKGTTNFISGFSSSGKTTLLTGIFISLMEQGEKICLITNEQRSMAFKIQFITWLLAKKFKYFKITKRKMKNRDEMTEEDLKMLKKAQKYWNENYKGKIKFIQISDADMGLVKKKFRSYILSQGITVCCYDTFKCEFADNNDNNWLQLIKDSRDLDKIAKKYDVVMLATMQLAQALFGTLFLDASCLSQSKQVKEILESLLMLRPVFSEELDKNNKKFYCSPFKRKKVGDKWIEEEYEADEGATYRMLFIEKNRNGENSSDNGIAILLKFLGSQGVFREVAFCKPKHGRIQ